MTKTILLLEDEPLILMDLEFAAQDAGCKVVSSANVEDALAKVAELNSGLTVAVLDVSLDEGASCFPVAELLDRHKIPFILHSGDLDRHDEKVRTLDAELVAKPASSDTVIAVALAFARGGREESRRVAAELG
jgi:DNA-binding response OmpR family regulator